MTMKTGSNLKFNDQYEYLTFDLDQEFLFPGDEIEIDDPFDEPRLRKFIKINDVTDDMLDIIYYQHQINKDVYKFVTMSEPPVRGRILIPKE